MNIRQAKEFIKDSVTLYLKKDRLGEYRIPVVRQRPIFLLGAPGIGKTAVMEQVASELGIALVSYSMTHHTRQSALGLPYIVTKTYDKKERQVSEYTMSEIIASVYETMEESGVKEGILFLDEINCVSETLAPSMLQFLQYKTFGRHKVPEGWIIVTAGNPPEYNRSVREFDVVTMDRLKVLEVEADYDAWKLYAREAGIHGAVNSFLELHKEYFYHVETTVKGRHYVTARGWEDLSEILYLYEEEGLKVTEALVSQYIRNEKIDKEFCAYYDLYQKYKKDYHIDEILSGSISDALVAKAKDAPFDERLSLLGMLLDKTIARCKEIMETAAYLQEMTAPLKAVKSAGDQSEMLKQQLEARKQLLEKQIMSGALLPEQKRKHIRIIQFLEGAGKDGAAKDEEIFALIKTAYDKEVAQMKQEVITCKENLSSLFAFVEKAFGEGNELLVLVTELTVNNDSAGFIASFGCEEYQKQNERLMISERTDRLVQQIRELEL
ncbi:MAG: AAA family ATPase [Lachnospiraceae bacterium]|nr:AAA family ATPase [Lachnospiraceae bacterium]